MPKTKISSTKHVHILTVASDVSPAQDQDGIPTIPLLSRKK